MIIRIILLFLCLLQASDELQDENTSEGFPMKPMVLLRPMRMNCTPPIIEQFPRSVISMLLKRHTVAAICAHALLAIYALVSMILVYKNLFLRSIDLICKEKKYSPSVIGATFMAVGSAMPEFAKNMIGVHTSGEYMGVSGVFPSVFYNIPYVLMIGICSFFAKKEHDIHCWSLYRDSLFYVLSILGLCFATFKHVIVWWKCVIMLSVYLVYCIVLCLNPVVEKMVHSSTNLSKCCRKNETAEIELSEVQRNENELAGQSVQQNLLINVNQEFNRNNEFDENDNPSTTICNIRIAPRCIGLPWFMETGVLRPGSSIPLITEKLVYFMLSTLISIIGVVMTICLNSQKLDSNLGRAFMGLFIIYNTLVFILNAFRRDDIPQCDTIY